jgi:hypothetical protein
MEWRNVGLVRLKRSGFIGRTSKGNRLFIHNPKRFPESDGNSLYRVCGAGILRLVSSLLSFLLRFILISTASMNQRNGRRYEKEKLRL